MIIKGREEGRGYKGVLHIIYKKLNTHSRLDDYVRKKHKSVLGFEPGPLRKNAIALLLAPPPRPIGEQSQLSVTKVRLST